MAKDKLRLYGGIARELIGFSMPLILSGVLQQLYNWVDAFIVGHVEGQLAMGSVGATTACVNLFLAVMMGFTVGLNVLMAQRHGAGEDEKVPRILSSFSVILCAVFVVVGALGFFFAGVLMLSVGMPLMLKLGVEKARIAITLCYLIPFVLLLAAEKLGLDWEKLASGLPDIPLLSLLAALSAAALAVSVLISVALYSKKEF